MKGWRTMIFMGLAGAVPALQMILEVAQIPEWAGYIPPEFWAPYSMGVTIMGIWLRFVTTGPVGDQSWRR